ncbi:RDD family protein [Isoptericola halotolerans]|uniref:RDD family protein n=1 Tax=Isoptericola halotolerans TaxID=300560 RepID=UPI00388E5430
MNDVVCAGCGSTQRVGAPFCAVCGREFPRTGRPVEISPDGPRGAVQESYGPTGHPYGGDPGDPASMLHTGTTEPEHLTATQVPSSYRQAPAAPPANPSFAHVGRRFVAHLIDGACAGLLFGVVYGVGLAFVDLPTGVFTPADPEFAAILGPILTVLVVALAVLLAFGVLQLVWEGRAGRTVGHALLGMRVQGADGGMPIGVGRAFLRYLVVAAGSLVLGIGQLVVLLSPLWDAGGRRQGWHDKAAKAVVVDARATAPRQTAQPSPPTVTPAPAAHRAAASYPTPTAAPAPGVAPSLAGPVPPSAGVSTPAPSHAPAGTGHPVAPTSGEDSLITGVPGVAESPEPAPVAPPTPAPAPTPTSAPAPPPTSEAAAPSAEPASPAEPDLPAEHTSFGETRMQAPAQRQALSPAAVATVELELESGVRQPVDGLARIGRNPEAGAGEQVLLIRVDDPSRSVSKNHADLGVDSAGLWLTDRGSTNGTVISAAGLPPRVAEPGTKVRVPMGSTIHVGDRRVVVHPGRRA